jgi:hypothetical protein
MNTEPASDVQGAAEELGGVVEDLTPSPHRFLVNALLAVPVFLAGVALTGLGLLGEFVFAQKAGVVAVAVSHVVLTLSGLLLISASIVLPYRIRIHRGLRLLVCRDGLVRASGDEVGVVRWEEITLVRLPRFRGIRDAILNGEARLLLRWGDGVEWKFDDVVVPAFSRLRKAVQEKTLTHMLQVCLDAHNAGETVRFGPVSAAPEGLTHAGATLPWAEFQGYHAGKGWITIKRKGAWLPWRRLAVPDVDNAHVLLGLLMTRLVIGVMRAKQGGAEQP